MDAKIIEKLDTAARGTQTGAIVRRVFDLTRDDETPRYVGNGTVTSDGFVMCAFIDSDGNYHMGAFVGALVDVEANATQLANYCNLNAGERADFYAHVMEWAGMPAEHVSDFCYATIEKAAARKRDAAEGFEQ